MVRHMEVSTGIYQEYTKDTKSRYSVGLEYGQDIFINLPIHPQSSLEDARFELKAGDDSADIWNHNPNNDW